MPGFLDRLFGIDKARAEAARDRAERERRETEGYSFWTPEDGWRWNPPVRRKPERADSDWDHT